MDLAPSQSPQAPPPDSSSFFARHPLLGAVLGFGAGSLLALLIGRVQSPEIFTRRAIR